MSEQLDVIAARFGGGGHARTDADCADNDTAATTQNVAVIIPVLAITALVFSNSVKNNFVNWDDNVNVYENKDIKRYRQRLEKFD